MTYVGGQELYQARFTLLIVLIFLLTFASICQAQYPGGSGAEANPYQISSVADWQSLMNTPDDWNKHFILTADLDLQGINLSPIGNSNNYFTGVFDGNGHIIRNADVNMPGSNVVGLFGRVDCPGQICDLCVENIEVTGKNYVGCLVGNIGYLSSLTTCYVKGSVIGSENVGGLVGYNWGATITACYATGSVRGDDFVGGLLGYIEYGSILTACYADGLVSGKFGVGGLVGWNSGGIEACYATSSVRGDEIVGGLVGNNSGSLTACYANGSVISGIRSGGLMGCNSGSLTACFWDVETSGQTGSAYGGKGLTTSEMKSLAIYRNAEWAGKGWVINDGQDCPRLDWENTGGVPIPEPESIPLLGSGTVEDPYQIWAASDFALLSWHTSILDKHIVLLDDLDLFGITLYPIGDLGPFIGTFEGNGHIVRNADVNIPSSDNVGLFGYLGEDGRIQNLGVEDIVINGRNHSGGLVGNNSGTLTVCYATGTVSGDNDVGILVGLNYRGSLTTCYATGSVYGNWDVGGLVGDNSYGSITACYANGSVSGANSGVGGLVGESRGILTACYATGSVEGNSSVGGLLGQNYGSLTVCFWDIEASGWTTSAGGTGKTTAEMKTRSTFTNAGWDFVGEKANGTEDIWSICEGTDYPRLTWQIPAADWLCPDGVGMEDFSYLAQFWMIPEGGNNPADLDKDNAVGISDLIIFCEQWLRTR